MKLSENPQNFVPRNRCLGKRGGVGIDGLRPAPRGEVYQSHCIDGLRPALWGEVYRRVPVTRKLPDAEDFTRTPERVE